VVCVNVCELYFCVIVFSFCVCGVGDVFMFLLFLNCILGTFFVVGILNMSCYVCGMKRFILS